MAHPIVVDPLPSPHAMDVPPAVTSWLERTDDPWLREMVRDALVEGDPWSTLVATGRYLRLREATDDEIEALSAGPPPGTSNDESRWVRSLTPETLDAALVHLQVAAERLHEAFEEIAEAVDPDDSEWRQSLLEILHARDDLEGVSLILHANQSGERARMALSALDEAGAGWLAALPIVAELAEDERLSRASVVSPFGWWTNVIAW